MVPAHNAARFLESTLESVIAAGPPAGTQIEVVDDGSTDDTQAIAARFSPRGVSYHRNPSQMGASANFNECIRRARGYRVHILHADDEVAPGFYDAIESAFDASDAVAAVTRAVYVDDEGRETTVTRSECPTGIWADSVAVLAVSNRIRPPAIVVRRSAYEAIGGFREDLSHAADWELWVRLAQHGPIWFEDRPLARYRVHQDQDTAKQLRRAANIDERVVALRMIADSLPARLRRQSIRRGLLYSAAFAGRTAVGMARRAEWSIAFAQAGAMVRCLMAGVVGSPGLALRGSPVAQNPD